MDVSLHEFEDNLKQLLSTYQFLTHTHAPTPMLVDNCAYCRKFGNVFVNGILSKQNLPASHQVFTCLKN